MVAVIVVAVVDHGCGDKDVDGGCCGGGDIVVAVIAIFVVMVLFVVVSVVGFENCQRGKVFSNNFLIPTKLNLNLESR